MTNNLVEALDTYLKQFSIKVSSCKEGAACTLNGDTKAVVRAIDPSGKGGTRLEVREWGSHGPGPKSEEGTVRDAALKAASILCGAAIRAQKDIPLMPAPTSSIHINLFLPPLMPGMFERGFGSVREEKIVLGVRYSVVAYADGKHVRIRVRRNCEKVASKTLLNFEPDRSCSLRFFEGEGLTELVVHFKRQKKRHTITLYPTVEQYRDLDLHCKGVRRLQEPLKVVAQATWSDEKYLVDARDAGFTLGDERQRALWLAVTPTEELFVSTVDDVIVGLPIANGNLGGHPTRVHIQLPELQGATWRQTPKSGLRTSRPSTSC